MQGDRIKLIGESPPTDSADHIPLESKNGSPASSKFVSADKKIVALRNLLEKDPRSADIKWSLFIAACQSYRYDSCLKPFPPQFIKNENKDIDALREVVDQTPALPLLLRHLQDPDVYQTSSQIIDLLYWVFIYSKDTKIKTIPKEQFKSVLDTVQCETPVQPPNFIFQVSSGPRSIHENKWSHLAKDKKRIYAFHGSRLENFHSILHHGLQQHLNKNALFGHGIYLSSELAVSLPYSPMGYAWGRSLLGSQMSCVALCEIIDHPDVKCQNEGENMDVEVVSGSGIFMEKNQKHTLTIESDKTRAMTSDSMGGEVPKKYYVVVNSDLVRVRYLLVYSKKNFDQREKNGSFLRWLGSHKLLTFIIGYVVLLASVGLSNNQYVQRYYKMLVHRAGY